MGNGRLSQQDDELAQLLAEVSRHYGQRGFDQRACRFLRWTIVANTCSGVFTLPTALHKGFTCSLADLLGYFSDATPVPASEDDVKGVQAIFAFNFGYRLPDPSDQRPITREPGQNNLALAQIALDLKRILDVPLFAQFEIARAIPGFCSIADACSSGEEDLNTRTAAEQFLVRAAQCVPPGGPLKRVAVVAHRHHVERCIQVLRKKHNVNGIPTHRQYSDYDPRECQPRVMSPEEYIVSDFVSMAASR
jgi:hypothetical protein